MKSEAFQILERLEANKDKFVPETFNPNAGKELYTIMKGVVFLSYNMQLNVNQKGMIRPLYRTLVVSFPANEELIISIVNGTPIEKKEEGLMIQADDIPASDPKKMLLHGAR